MHTLDLVAAGHQVGAPPRLAAGADGAILLLADGTGPAPGAALSLPASAKAAADWPTPTAGRDCPDLWESSVLLLGLLLVSIAAGAKPTHETPVASSMAYTE